MGHYGSNELDYASICYQAKRYWKFKARGYSKSPYGYKNRESYGSTVGSRPAKKRRYK